MTGSEGERDKRNDETIVMHPVRIGEWLYLRDSGTKLFISRHIYIFAFPYSFFFFFLLLLRSLIALGRETGPVVGLAQEVMVG